MTGKRVKRAYRYRFYPTPEQAGLLNRTFGCVRYVYSRALAERSRAWTQEQERVTFAGTCRMLTAWKAEPETAWLYEVSNVALQQGLQHLQNAFVNFWGKRAKYPTFKSRRKSKASATFTTSGFRYKDGRITLAKMAEPLDIRWSRPLPEGAEPSTVTVSRDAAGRWHISVLVETTVEELPPLDSAVGIDAGITSLLTLSTGEKIANPRHERRDRQRLARAQRAKQDVLGVRRYRREDAAERPRVGMRLLRRVPRPGRERGEGHTCRGALRARLRRRRKTCPRVAQEGDRQ